MQHEQVLRRPLVTEKATKTIEAQNAYAFEVDPKADKPAIKAAVEAIYNVRVLRVTTQNRKGEMRRNRYGHTSVRV